MVIKRGAAEVRNRLCRVQAFASIPRRAVITAFEKTQRYAACPRFPFEKRAENSLCLEQPAKNLFKVFSKEALRRSI